MKIGTYLKMKKYLLGLLLCAALFVGCQTDNTEDYASNADGVTILTVSISKTRTYLGAKDGDTYPIYWSEGDRISVNGVVSKEAVINPESNTSAQFTINAALDFPRAIIYSGEYSSSHSESVYFPAEQSYEPNSIKTGYAPMYGYVTTQNEHIRVKHLAGILNFPIKSAKSGVTLQSITIESNSGEPLAGYFAIDCSTGVLSATNEVEDKISYIANIPLSTDSDTIFNIVAPAGEYAPCTITFTDSEGNTMVSSWNPSTIKAGVVREFKSITYKANTKLGLEAFDSCKDSFLGSVPCCGWVVDTNGAPISGVVITDGEVCTQTDEYGCYEMDIDLDNTKFIYASIPSGYKAPSDANGLPQFYHLVTDAERRLGYCIVDFKFEPISGDPNRYTLLIGADPQPRAKTAGDDRVAYHSLDICESLYRDMRETRAAITDREVYGMMLGDIVHENMSLFSNYIKGVKTIGLHMFNVIGNHDHDLSATTDEEGARRFEENFGPSYYSFNIGKQHFVVLDNIIMTVVDGKLKKNEYDYGLTDKQWQWLQNDLSYVDKSTTLMVAAHCPMFKKDSAKAEYQDQSNHGADYAALLKQYSKVHAWAGHTHRSFNYNYPSTNTLKNIEVHTLARSTGEFWSNDYNAYGTPRGYTIVEVDGENISWEFKPLIYQSEYIGSNYSTVGAPAYNYRDWEYNNEGVAIMKKSGKPLDDSYQMQVWREGNYVYVNIFMWDSKWEKPKFNGSSMTQLDRQSSYAIDYPYKELYSFYSVNSILSGYDYSYSPVYHNSIFRVYSSASTGSGTISVKDRFGNTYTSDFSW